jgi:hypothetical protein
MKPNFNPNGDKSMTSIIIIAKFWYYERKRFNE